MTSISALSPCEARSPPKAWKNAIAIAGAVAMFPVVALILFLVLWSAVPALVLAVPLLAVAWAPTVRRSPSRSAGSVFVTHAAPLAQSA
jgi:fatty acid desaturase